MRSALEITALLRSLVSGRTRAPRPCAPEGSRGPSVRFFDALAYTFPDPDHSAGEERLLTFGHSQGGRLLAVIHAERDRAIRIISARRATRNERGIYEQG